MKYSNVTLSNKIKYFFWHLSAEYALSIGWDLESDLSDFYKDKDLSSVAFSRQNLNLLEEDIFKASLGIVTDNFAEFFLSVQVSLDTQKPSVVLQSMHSGSSEYLYVTDVLEMQESFKNVVA